MDEKLVRWARAVKSRRRGLEGGRAGIPPLWLFTDAVRMGDLAAVVRGLPKGLCGVVFRHDGVAGRAALGRAVWRICRARRLTMVAAGAALGLAGVGSHLRGGRRGGAAGARRFCTASVHEAPDMVRARRAGAEVAFVSPVFATASHAGVRPLGVVRWSVLARGFGGAAMALGGVDGASAARLPRFAAGVGAIGALSGSTEGL